MKKILSTLLICIILVGCGATNNEEKKQTTENTTTEESLSGKYFKDGKLVVEDLELKITNSKIIKDEYSEDKLILFEYDLKNIKSEDLNMITANLLFNAYQDNNPNIENKLKVGPTPAKYLDIQLQKIKKGGTIKGAMTFVLTDTKTDVVLKAVLGLDEEIGQTVYKIK